MVNVLDVAKYILKEMGEVSVMKLQKLVYYSQVWSLVWDERPLFRDRIEAWVSGPVVRRLYQAHRGQYSLKAVDLSGDVRKLSKVRKKTISDVIKYYGKHNAQWLSDLTHMEKPWQKARKGLSDSERGMREITHASMQNYYHSL